MTLSWETSHTSAGRYGAIVTLTMGLLASAALYAQVPENLSYQGVLADAVGEPVSGSVDVDFSLYADPTGGTALWTDSQSVTTQGGVFTVILGDDANPFPADLFDGLLFLGVTVDDDVEMSPRTPLTSVAFSRKAQDAQTLAGRTASELDQSNEVGANQVAVIQLQIDVQSAQTDIGQLETGLQSAETDVTVLQTSVQTAQSDISQLQTDVNANEAALDLVELELPGLQSRVSGSCSSGSSIRQVLANGSVTCEIDDDGHWQVNGSSQPYLLGGGRVGIGTSAPAASIQIDSPADVDPFRARVQSSTKLRVHMNGSVSVGTSSAGSENGLFVNGRAGIGTNSPSAKTTVQDPGWQFSLNNNDTGGGDWYIGSSADAWAAGGGKLIFAPTDSSSNPAVAIDSSRNVGIGLASPATRLHIAGGSDVNPVSGGFVTIGNETSSHIAIDNNEIMARNNGAVAPLALNAEGGKVTVNSGGSRDDRAMEITGEVLIDSGQNSNFIIGATDSSPTNAVIYPSLFEEGLLGYSAFPFWRVYSREFYAQTPLQYKTYSDRSIKRNVQPIQYALQAINQIEGVTYELMDHPFDKRGNPKSDTQKFYNDNQLGFIAQDLELILPQLVSEDEDSGLKTVSYMGLIPVLVEALKEQQQQIDEQWAEIEDLKAQLQ